MPGSFCHSSAALKVKLKGNNTSVGAEIPQMQKFGRITCSHGNTCATCYFHFQLPLQMYSCIRLCYEHIVGGNIKKVIITSQSITDTSRKEVFFIRRNLKFLLPLSPGFLPPPTDGNVGLSPSAVVRPKHLLLKGPLPLLSVSVLISVSDMGMAVSSLRPGVIKAGLSSGGLISTRESIPTTTTTTAKTP